MRLGEALQIIGQAAGERKVNVHLLCGFMPLHLETFIKAYLARRFTGSGINVRTGLYGDLEGNIQRARESGGDGAIAVIEWSDLDRWNYDPVCRAGHDQGHSTHALSATTSASRISGPPAAD
jgi:hypothetical protein